MIDWLLSSPEENSDNVWIIWKLCAIYPPKTTFMVRTTASDPGFFERSICHDGNNLAFMYTREFAHSYPRSRPLFHARFDAGSAIFLLGSTSRSRSSKTDLFIHTIGFLLMIWYSQQYLPYFRFCALIIVWLVVTSGKYSINQFLSCFCFLLLVTDPPRCSRQNHE